jgi:hypothetical protein
MRLLKLMLAAGFALCVVSVFLGSHAASSGLRIFWSIIDAAIFVGAFYGIHKRAPLMWKLGFIGIIIGAASFLMHALSLTRSVPRSNAQIESSFLVVATIAVASYWGFWWKRQKSYFVD